MLKVAEEYKYAKGIYMLKNMVTYDFYIGSTIATFFTRIQQHKYSHTKEYNKTYLCNAMRYYGIENFKVILLEITDQKMISYNKEIFERYVRLREKYYIDLLNPKYNIRKETFFTGYKEPIQLYKAVTRYDKNKNKIKDYNSITEAAKDVDSINLYAAISKIAGCCRGEDFSAYNSRWSFKDEELADLKGKSGKRGKHRNIFIKDDNEYIEFKTIRECAKYIGSSVPAVSRYIRKNQKFKDIIIGKV